MTIEQRLDGICRMINERRQEDGGEEWTMVWSVQPGPVGYTYAVAAIDLRYAQETTGDHIVLTWLHTGIIDARVTLAQLIPGSITSMAVLAAQHPQGDFQVAEALEAIT